MWPGLSCSVMWLKWRHCWWMYCTSFLICFGEVKGLTASQCIYHIFSDTPNQGLHCEKFVKAFCLKETFSWYEALGKRKYLKMRTKIHSPQSKWFLYRLNNLKNQPTSTFPFPVFGQWLDVLMKIFTKKQIRVFPKMSSLFL